MIAMARADTLEPGDVIEVGTAPYETVITYRIVDSKLVGSDMHLTTEVRGWGDDTRGEMIVDYRHTFNLIARG